MTVAVLARESRAVSPAKASLTMLLSQGGAPDGRAPSVG